MLKFVQLLLGETVQHMVCLEPRQIAVAKNKDHADVYRANGILGQTDVASEISFVVCPQCC